MQYEIGTFYDTIYRKLFLQHQNEDSFYNEYIQLSCPETGFFYYNDEVIVLTQQKIKISFCNITSVCFVMNLLCHIMNISLMTAWQP